jgi:hypothetical protein
LSRLDSAIRRLQAQRAGLDWACAKIVPGLVLELGLGNGRTYDHLRSRLGAGFDIHAFDRAVAAHPDCVPPHTHLHLGDMRQTLPHFAGRNAVLIHADTGSGESLETAAFAAFLGATLGALLGPKGLVLSDQELAGPGLAALPPPDGVPPGRYFFYGAKSIATGT